LVQDAIGDEGCIDAVQGGAEPFEHAGQRSDDVGEAVQGPSGAQGFGVMADRLEAQHVLAFGVALEGQVPEVDLEDRQAVLRCLDHSTDAR
jgi:hypothetical protein